MPRKQLPIGAQKPASTPGEVTEAPKSLDVVGKFMRENPKDSLPDPPEQVLGEDGQLHDDTFDAKADPAKSAEEALLADARSESSPEVQAEKPTEEVKAEAAPEVKPEVEQPKAEQPEIDKSLISGSDATQNKPPSYDPTEKIHLLEGVDPWTRDDIVRGLQERATLQPKAEEADKFRQLLGGEYAEAEQRWLPTLQRLAANPQRTQFLEELLASDNPQELSYLIEAKKFFNQETGQSAPAQQQPQAVAADSPEIRQLRSENQAMIKYMMNERAKNEWATAEQMYPVIKNNAKVRQAIAASANLLFAQDEKAGVPLMERKGLIDALQAQSIFLESMQAAENAQRRAPIAPPIEPSPERGAEALLTSAGPGASGAARNRPVRTKYHANPKDEFGGDPTKAFLSDHPS